MQIMNENKAIELLAAMLGAPEGYRPILLSKNYMENLVLDGSFATRHVYNGHTEVVFVKGDVQKIDSIDGVYEFSKSLFDQVQQRTQSDIQLVEDEIMGLRQVRKEAREEKKETPSSMEPKKKPFRLGLE